LIYFRQLYDMVFRLRPDSYREKKIERHIVLPMQHEQTERRF
jgi:hypothetical protein